MDSDNTPLYTPSMDPTHTTLSKKIQDFFQDPFRHITAFLKNATQVLIALLEALYTNLFSLFLLLILFYFYWIFPQGKDLLLTLNQQSDIEVSIFFFTLVTLGAICWYLPRLTYEENRPPSKTPILSPERDPPSPAASTRSTRGGFNPVSTDDPVPPSQPEKKQVAMVEMLRDRVKKSVFFQDTDQHTVESYIETEVKTETEQPGVPSQPSSRETRRFEPQPAEARPAKPGKPTLTPDKRMGKYRKLFKEHLPRLLGSMVPFVIAFGMLNVMQEYNDFQGFSAFWWLVAVFLFMTFMASKFNSQFFKECQEEYDTFHEWLLRAVLVYGGTSVILLIFFMTKNQGDLRGLKYLFWATILVGAGFFIYTVVRKPLAKHLTHKSIHEINRTFKFVLFAIIVFTLILGIGFILLNIFPSWSRRFNPLVCANLAFVLYIGMLYGLRIWGAWKGVFIVMIFSVVLVLMYLSFSKDRHHTISMVDDNRPPSHRMQLPEYFDKWLETRSAYIEAKLDSANPTFPIFVVSSEGGGSRAAYWTIRTHQALQNSHSAYFDKHLFALTGASGGNTGNSAYLAMKTGGVPDSQVLPAAREMFSQNFLSSSITLFLGLDQWKNLIAAGGRDRAKALEKDWTRALERVTEEKGSAGAATRASWDNALLSLWYEAGSNTLVPKPELAPLLLINATHVQKGGHGIFSPVKLAPHYYRGMDLLDSVYKYHRGKTVPLKTANLLNASFPYVNPAGYIPDVGNFVDAGYYDNYGAQTAISLLEELKAYRAASPDTALIHKLTFVSILIRNSTIDGDNEAYVDRESVQLRAPLQTLGNIRSAVNAFNRRELAEVADESYEVNLLPRQEIEIVENGDTIQPAVPLARYLSGLAIKAMDAAMDSLEVQPANSANAVLPLEEENRSFFERNRRGDLTQIKARLSP